MASLPNKNTEIGQSSASATAISDRKRNRVQNQDQDRDFTSDRRRRRGRPSRTTLDGTIILPPRYKQNSVAQNPLTMSSAGGNGGAGSGGSGSSSSRNVYGGPRSGVLLMPTLPLPPVPVFQPNYFYVQQNSIGQNPPTMSSSGGGGGSGSGSGNADAGSSSSNVDAGQRSVVVPTLTLPLQPAPVFQPNYDVDVRGLHFLFEKKLKPSDVNIHGRIIIPKRVTEAFLPRLEDKNGILLDMHDVDRVRIWTFRFRFWQKNDSRMYLFENTSEFVKAHDLVSGDYVLFYIDRQSGFYYIRAQKMSEIPMLEPTRTFVREVAIPQVSSPSVSLDIDFSTTEEELTKPPFLFDTALTSDHLLVCAKLDPLPEIGSEESIWFDDFL